jgi:hypothetical protein
MPRIAPVVAAAVVTQGAKAAPVAGRALVAPRRAVVAGQAAVVPRAVAAGLAPAATVAAQAQVVASRGTAVGAAAVVRERAGAETAGTTCAGCAPAVRPALPARRVALIAWEIQGMCPAWPAPASPAHARTGPTRAGSCTRERWDRCPPPARRVPPAVPCATSARSLATAMRKRARASVVLIWSGSARERDSVSARSTRH